MLAQDLRLYGHNTLWRVEYVHCAGTGLQNVHVGRGVLDTVIGSGQDMAIAVRDEHDFGPFRL